MTENKGVKPATRADLSDHQIRELPIGSLRDLNTAQLPPGGGESVGRRLRVARALSKARRSRGCGTVENRSATRQGRAVFQAPVGNRPRPAEGGRFSKVAVGGRREGHRDRPKAGALSAGLPQSPAGAAVPQPSLLNHRCRTQEISSAVGRPFRIASGARMVHSKPYSTHRFWRRPTLSAQSLSY